MTFFPVPHNAPARSTPIPVRGNASAAVKQPVLPREGDATPMPSEIRELVAKTSRPLPPPDEQVTPVPQVVPEIPDLPSMTQMAQNVLGSFMKTAKSAFSGNGVKVTRETAEARLAICRTCPFFRTTDERCSKCGCVMAVKTYLKAESCPVGKW